MWVGAPPPTPHLGKTDPLLGTMPQYCPPTDKTAPNIEIICFSFAVLIFIPIRQFCTIDTVIELMRQLLLVFGIFSHLISLSPY